MCVDSKGNELGTHAGLACLYIFVELSDSNCARGSHFGQKCHEAIMLDIDENILCTRAPSFCPELSAARRVMQHSERCVRSMIA